MLYVMRACVHTRLKAYARAAAVVLQVAASHEPVAVIAEAAPDGTHSHKRTLQQMVPVPVERPPETPLRFLTPTRWSQGVDGNALQVVMQSTRPHR